MRTKRLSRNLKFASYRAMALFLSALMLLSVLDFSVLLSSAAASDGGFNISIKWNGTGQDPNLFESFSDSEEQQLVRLKVIYENKKVTAGYQPGEIVITLPGIKNAVRSGNSYYPAAIAADKASESTKNYDWSYTYSNTSDTFTFTNNMTISANSTFEGSFEIIWSLPSRETKDGFSKDLQAKLRTAENDQAISNSITYSQTRQRDAYTLRQEVSQISSAEGLRGILPDGMTEYDYTWVRYDVYGTDTYYARDVRGNERFDYWFLEGVLVDGAGLTKTDKVQEINGQTYECWSVERNITKYSSNPYLKNVYAAYPNEKYAGQTVSSYVFLQGTYYDETQESELARSEIPVNLPDFGFIDIPGNIYDVTKYSYGKHSSYINNHCGDCYWYGAVNSVHMAEGMAEYNSRLSLLLNYDKDDAEYFDLEFVDDIMDVMTTDGGVRQLNDDEYNFTKVVIPSADNVSNANGYAIEADKYEVEVYARKAGAGFTDFELIETTSITNSSQSIDVPDDTVGVKVLVKGVQESLNTLNIDVYYKFHTSADDILLNNGTVANYMYFNMYDDKGEWFNSEFDGNRDTYTSDRDFERDLVRYGHTYDREVDTIHILEVPNEYSSTTTITKTSEDKEAYYFTGEIGDRFNISEGNTLSRFSVYTIVPEGLRLQELYNTPDALLDCLTFYLDNSEAEYIKDHVLVEIIDNYKDSGREFIAFHYDFSDNPITPNDISVKGIPMYHEKDLVKSTTESFTMYSLTLIDQSGKWYTTSVDNNSREDGIWNDIDNDGDTSESAAYSYSNVTILNPESSNLQFTKSVKTSLSNGYVQPAFDEETNSYVENEIPYTYKGYEYSYKLRLRTGESLANHVVFVDTLETGERKEWQGTFVRADTSYAEKLLGEKPTVYYSSTEVDAHSKPNLADTAVWTTTKPAVVKSIAVDCGDSMLPTGASLYIEIYMKAPANEDGELDYKITENLSHVYYDKYDPQTEVFLESQDLPSNDVPVSLSPFMGRIKIVKSDSLSHEKLSDAVFSLYEMLGDEPDPENDKLVSDNLKTDNSGVASIKVKYGSYYVIETAAPRGYKLDETPKKIVLDGDHPNVVVTADIENDRKEGQFTLTKVSDRNKEAYLAGATFELYSAADDKLIKDNLVTDENGEIKVTGLAWGEYYVKEVKAPDGFTISNEKISFTVNAAGDAQAAVTVENEQIPGTVILEKTEVLEDGTTKTGEPLDGAAYKLYTSDDKLIGTYMTNDDGKIYVDDLTFGDYYFKESIAAQGYALNPDKIEFTINGSNLQKDSTVSVTVKTTDTRLTGSLWLQKVDDTGAYVKNAEYALFRTSDDVQVDETGKPSDKVFTTSDEGIIEIEGLYWGDYYIKETKSPLGYELNDTKYPVKVNRETVNNRIMINAVDQRGKGSVELTKVAENDETVKLEGAVYTLYKNDGTVYRDDLVTGKDGILLVKDIEWGSYYFMEKTPPQGYGLSDEKIRFSVNYLTAGKVQKVTAADPMIKAELAVTKKIKTDDVVFAHGNPTFTFKLDGTDVNGKSYTFFKNVTFNELVVQSSQGEYAEQTVVFADLPAGTWTVSEVQTLRYTLGTVEATTANGTVDNDNGTVTFKLNDDKGEAVFTNDKVVQSSTTHTEMAVNIAKTDKKLTAIVALWQGGDTVTSEKLDRTQLDVYAVYDDGSQTKLDDDAYTLDQEEFDGTMNGDYTVTATYSEGGKTCSDSFVLNLKLPMPFTWTVTEGAFDENGTHYDGTATITGYTGSSSVMNIPGKVNGIRTLKNYNTGKVSYIDNGKTYKVTVIGNGYVRVYGAVNCTGVIFPDTVEVISDRAFSKCVELTGILTIPASVTSIGGFAFSDNSSDNACKKLTGLVFEEDSQLKTIGRDAFFWCTGLTGTVTIPANVTSIGVSAFDGCRGLNSLEFAGGMQPMTIGETAFDYCTGLTGTLTIPKNVTSIGEKAFATCRNLTGLEFESGGTQPLTIGDYAFTYCTELAGELKIPARVTSIGTGAFSNAPYTSYACTKLTSLVFEKDSQLETIGEGAFFNCNGLSNELIIPASVTLIDDCAFYQCVDLPSLKFEDGGTESMIIDQYAFSRCIGLTGTLKIPARVTTIGDYAFSDTSSSVACKKLTGLVFEKGSDLKIIGNFAFYCCTGLTGTLTIPKNVTSIGNGAFENCKCLTGLTFEGGGTQPLTIGAAAFTSCTELAGELKIPARVTSIGYSAFSDTYDINACAKLTSLVFEENSQLKTIGDCAFKACRGLTGTLTMPESVTSIGRWAFSGCSGLTGTLTIPKNVTSIGNSAFYGCGGLTGLEFESGGSEPLTIEDNAFRECRGLTGTLTIPKNVTSVGVMAFWYCTGLTRLEFETGSQLETIGQQAFQYCSGLNGTLTIPKNVTSIGGLAFDTCSRLTGLEFENGSKLETIGWGGFKVCNGLTGTVTIPAGVTSVGEDAFKCENLTLLRIPDTLTTEETYGAPNVEYYTP